MKKLLLLLVIMSGCSKTELVESKSDVNALVSGIRFLANNVEWRSGVNPGEAISASNVDEFSYYAQIAGANEFYISGYSSVDSITSKFEKFAIYLPAYTGPGTYAISSSTNKAQFLKAVAGQNESESFYSNDDASNFLTIDSIVDQKVYGRFAFNAESESNVLKVSEGSFKDVPIW